MARNEVSVPGKYPVECMIALDCPILRPISGRGEPETAGPGLFLAGTEQRMLAQGSQPIEGV